MPSFFIITITLQKKPRNSKNTYNGVSAHRSRKRSKVMPDTRIQHFKSHFLFWQVLGGGKVDSAKTPNREERNGEGSEESGNGSAKSKVFFLDFISDILLFFFLLGLLFSLTPTTTKIISFQSGKGQRHGHVR